MPRFFFDTFDGDTFFEDRYGLDLSDPASARVVALEALPEVARSTLPDRDRRRMSVVVSDESDMIIFEATLTLEARWIEDGEPRKRVTGAS